MGTDPLTEVPLLVMNLGPVILGRMSAVISTLLSGIYDDVTEDDVLRFE